MENKSFENKLSSTQAISLILTFCSISALFIYLVYTKIIVFGSTPGNWKYPYFRTMNSIPFWIPLAALFLTGVLIYLGSRLIQIREKSTLLGCFFIAVVIQVLLQRIYQFSLDQIIISNGTNSFLPPAMDYSPFEILSQYHTLAPSFLLHARTNMPGKILFFQFLLLFTKSPQLLGYMVIFASTLGGPILYGICKRLFQDKTLALYAFVLYTLIPCKQDFSGILNTVTPVFILISLYLFLVYLDSKKKLFLILLGFSLYILALFEPSPLVMGVLFVGILIHEMVLKKVSIKELISMLMILILSFAAIYILVEGFFSFDLWQAFQYMMKDAVEFNLSNHRNYTIWLMENLKEFFYGAGLPTMMIFIYFIMTIFSQWKSVVKEFPHSTKESIYALSLLLTFGIVLFLGINRGETTRLWIYLAAFFQVPAAYFMAKTAKSNALFFILAATLIAQTVITLQRVRFLNPY